MTDLLLAIQIGFLEFRLLDLVDILAVAVLLYIVYKLIRGSMAFNIFVGIAFVYLLWFIVKQLDMQLLQTILGQFIGVGVIALLIVFQPEVRRFLLFVGKGRMLRRWAIFRRFLGSEQRPRHREVQAISKAVRNLSKRRIGALIVVNEASPMQGITRTGTAIGAEVTSQLLETIFQKTAPLHDGAVVISGGRIVAAGCTLPVSENTNLPKRIGTRHKAGVGITEQSDALAIIVSEETGKVAIARNGVLSMTTSDDLLREAVEDALREFENERIRE